MYGKGDETSSMSPFTRELPTVDVLQTFVPCSCWNPAGLRKLLLLMHCIIAVHVNQCQCQCQCQLTNRLAVHRFKERCILEQLSLFAVVFILYLLRMYTTYLLTRSAYLLQLLLLPSRCRALICLVCLGMRRLGKRCAHRCCCCCGVIEKRKIRNITPYTLHPVVRVENSM
ncbi:hypothetical protein F5Y00DRAFT_246392 [Daldinia vernicosa]|uniref:uncharacterized protein n=1 Tax=Daldinia vernicosa TaxID=114800 RepID=UPI002008E9DF|nr:uncharacterized protein F5Y00DRAFT_246392 [Daldinia vernicosa]KAI0845357.1 hypothetical protein F5Y00DRAFT_246392 [Daldinia vernicosa]